jgi:hypothetical protein
LKKFTPATLLSFNKPCRQLAGARWEDFMTDRHIDQDETQIYGAHAATKIRSLVVGLVPVFDPALQHLATEIEHATTAVATAVSSARGTDTVLRKEVKGKSAALASAVGVLGRFSKHLDTHKADTLDRKAFFTADGTAKGAGTTPPRVLLALTHLSGEIKNKSHPLNDRDRWLGEVTTALAELSPVVTDAESARTERRLLTPEVESARQAWLQIYKASRCAVECVLRLTGKLDLLSLVFHDLAVPAAAKVTEAPAETPAASAPGA